MHEYLKTSLPAILSVRSIVTVYHRKLDHYTSKGEAHDFPELMYVEKGPTNVTVDDTLYEMESGEIMIYAPFSKHGSRKPTDATISIISFESDSKELDTLYNRIIKVTGKQKEMISSLVTAGVQIFENNRKVNGLVGMAPREGTAAYELQKIKNQLELLLIDILHTENPGYAMTAGINHKNYESEQSDMLTAYLKEHLCEALTLEQIGGACAMSVSKLKRFCNRQYGCAPITYLISLRISEAKRMIRETSMNFTQIAEALGFGSVHYFSKQFKDKTGVTPSEYAKPISEK